MEMISDLFGNLLAIFVVLAFVTIVLLPEGLYLTWNAYKGPEAKRIEKRSAQCRRAAPGRLRLRF
jgi:tight adherence protein B